MDAMAGEQGTAPDARAAGGEAMLIVDGRRHAIMARIEGGAFMVSAEVVGELLGWTAEPVEDGRIKLCRDEQCVMLSDGVAGPEGIDLCGLAARLDCAFEVDAEARAGSWVRSAGEQAARLRGELAPDVLLTDMDGGERWLSALFGRKLMLLAYASW